MLLLPIFGDASNFVSINPDQRGIVTDTKQELIVMLVCFLEII